VSTGLCADRKDRLGGACAVVPNQLTGGLKVQVKRLAWLLWWNQHARGNTVEVCYGFLGGVTGVQSGPTPNQVGGITTVDAGAVARLHDRGGIPSLGRGCDVSEQLCHGVACRGVAERVERCQQRASQCADAFSP